MTELSISSDPSVIRRHHAAVFVVLAVLSFLLYAAGVFTLHQDRAPGWSIEGEGALPTAVSYLTYGTPLGAVDSNVMHKFLHPNGKSIQEVLAMAASRSIPAGTTELTTTDGIGAGTNLFATIAMSLFGPKISSLIILYLLTIGMSVAAFVLRFRDRRLIAVPLYCFIATEMLLTPLISSADAVDQLPIGGQRYFVLAAILPALHIFFEVFDRSAPTKRKRQIFDALLLFVQAVLLFGALLVRSSASYLLIGLFAAWTVSVFRQRRQPSRLRTLLGKAAVAAGAFLVWAGVVVALLPAYAESGRALGNFWHRTFISLTLHREWPFSGLREVYDCTKYIPEGLHSANIDQTGHCVWLVYPPNAHRSTGDVNAKTYSGEYEKALRQAYFYVLTHYPAQMFDLYVSVKSGLIWAVLSRAWMSLSGVIHAPPELPLAIGIAQVLIFAAFVMLLAGRNRIFFDPQLTVFPIFFILSLAPLYAAWASLFTVTDTVFLMFSCAVLAALLLAQLIRAALFSRTLPEPSSTR